MSEMFENCPESNASAADVRRANIVEAMAAAIRRERERPAIRSLEWSQKAPERMATAALDAAVPLIRQALAEKVREAMFTAESAREAIRAGMAVGEVGAWDEALEQAALLIEEVEL